jgi:hypothetical protein
MDSTESAPGESKRDRSSVATGWGRAESDAELVTMQVITIASRVRTRPTEHLLNLGWTQLKEDELSLDHFV